MNGAPPGKIMLDASPLRYRQTGIGHYTAQLIAALKRAGMGDELQLHDFGLGRRRIDTRAREWARRLLGDERYLWLRERMFRRHFTKIRPGETSLIYHATNNIPPIELDLPCVTTVHDLSVLRLPQQHPEYRVEYFRRYFSRTLRSTRIVTVSEFSRRDLLESFPQLEGRVTTVYPGVNDFYRPLPAGQGTTTARRFTHKPFLLCIGSIEPRKNIAGLLHAYRIVREKHDVALLIVGGLAWKYQPILELHARLGLKDAIFTGYLSEKELRELYSATELFIFPSIFEGFGLPPVEAMACGAPVALSGAASLPEAGGEAAAYFDPADPEHMATVIDALLSDSVRRAQMKTAGPRQASRFSWDTTALRMLEIYAATLAA